MASEAQIQANRRNARKSTGPRTPVGKAVASRNATRFGLYSRDLLLPGEDSGALDALREDVFRRFNPKDAAETLYVERFVTASWRLQRALAGEAKLLARWAKTSGFTGPGDVYTDPVAAKELDRVHRHIAGLERSMDRALSELRRLQKSKKQSTDEIETDSCAESAVLDEKSACIEIVKSKPILMREASIDGPQPRLADPLAGRAGETDETNRPPDDSGGRMLT